MGRPRLPRPTAPSRWTCSATPCGPRASTTRPTSTTTSPPASATTGRDSTAACGAADGRRARRLEARPARPQPRPPVNTVQDLSARGVGLRVLVGDGAQIDTTTAAGRLVFGIFAALDRVRAGAGLKGRAGTWAQGRQEVRADESSGAAGPGRDGRTATRRCPRCAGNSASGRPAGPVAGAGPEGPRILKPEVP